MILDSIMQYKSYEGNLCVSFTKALFTNLQKLYVSSIAYVLPKLCLICNVHDVQIFFAICIGHHIEKFYSSCVVHNMESITSKPHDACCGKVLPKPYGKWYLWKSITQAVLYIMCKSFNQVWMKMGPRSKKYIGSTFWMEFPLWSKWVMKLL